MEILYTDYDTKAGVMNAITNLASFHQLLKERRKAMSPAIQGVRLQEFVIFGQWILDSFGQLGIITEIHDSNYKTILSTIQKVIPSLLTKDEFKLFLRQYNAGFSYGICNETLIPDIDTKCTCCGETWSMENLHDYTSIRKHIEAKELTQFLTKEEYFRCATIIGVTFRLDEENWLVNTDVSSILNQVTGKKWQVCYDDEVTKNKIVSYAIDTYYHHACYADYLFKETKQTFTKAIEEAGIKVNGVVRTKNLYGSLQYRSYWFIVDTDIGHLLVGWRKRVIEINYSMIDPKYVSQTEETVGPGYEHVYGYEKLTEALVAFKQHLEHTDSKSVEVPDLFKK